MKPQEADFHSHWRKMRSCFREAAALFAPPIEQIEVPFEGELLPGYFWKPEESTQRRPTLIVIGLFVSSTVVLDRINDEEDGTTITIYSPQERSGSEVLRPGEHPSLKGIRSPYLFDKLNFLSLMLALFCGTASLPHILIRYYTVKDQAAARKSTVVGIGRC
jgi:hypothetical protein